MSTATAFVAEQSEATNSLGYKTFSAGQFRFERDEYFAHIFYPGGRHLMHIEAFLRALMRDVGWGFFYGTVNFDNVLGTINHYGTVELFAGLYNDLYRSNNRHYVETFQSKDLKKVFEAMLDDWTNEGFDPYAAPDETGLVYGPKHGSNTKALKRERIVAKRMVGLPGDLGLRTDEGGQPVNRQFLDVPQDAPEVHPEPGFENEVHAFNMFAYASRSDVTWNPSVVSNVKDSQICATTEEHMLPIFHGNDRVEWFIQVCDEIIWDVEDGKTGRPRAKEILPRWMLSAKPLAAALRTPIVESHWGYSYRVKRVAARFMAGQPYC